MSSCTCDAESPLTLHPRFLLDRRVLLIREWVSERIVRVEQTVSALSAGLLIQRGVIAGALARGLTRWTGRGVVRRFSARVGSAPFVLGRIVVVVGIVRQGTGFISKLHCTRHRHDE